MSQVKRKQYVNEPPAAVTEVWDHAGDRWWRVGPFWTYGSGASKFTWLGADHLHGPMWDRWSG